MQDTDLQELCLQEIRVQLVGAEAVAVEVHDGIVILSGFVESSELKTRTQDLVKELEGVKAIIQKIEVCVPPEVCKADEALARAITEALECNPSLPTDQVQAVVKDGEVFLEGTVKSSMQKRAAEAAARSVVEDAVSHIEVAPQPTEIWEEIEQALLRHVSHHAQHIRVKVDGDVVILSGTVCACFEKVEAEVAARAFPGVKRVENHLTLHPLAAGQEAGSAAAA